MSNNKNDLWKTVAKGAGWTLVLGAVLVGCSLQADHAAAKRAKIEAVGR